MDEQTDPRLSSVETVSAFLVDLWNGLQSRLSQEQQRNVSFGDLVQDRWSRAQAYGFGAGSSCYDNVLVIGDVTVGCNSWVGPNTVLDGSGGLIIGDHCTISAGAQIYTHNSIATTTSLGQSPIVRKTTNIGDGVYIGPGAVIQMGITIGGGAVVGALSLVNKDVPPGGRCFGVPGRIQDPNQIPRPNR